MKQKLVIALTLLCLVLSACDARITETEPSATLESDGPKTPQALQPTPVADALFVVVRADGSSQGFTLDELGELPLATIQAEGKIEEGPKLMDVLNAAGVTDFSEVTLTGSNGSITLPVEQVDDNTILDFTNRGTVKLASTYVHKADWIKDITEIRVK
jgi:hypothetical protein